MTNNAGPLGPQSSTTDSMFTVHFLTADRKRGCLAMNNLPLLFNEEDGWACIAEMMAQQDHPRLMWLRKVTKNADH